MSTGTLLVADHICSIIIPTEQLGQMTCTTYNGLGTEYNE